mgnify:CR=1 FL=1
MKGYESTTWYGVMGPANLPTLTERFEMNYGSDRLRFLAPVRAGSRVRGRFTLLELREKRPGEWREKTEMVVEIEGQETPALSCEWMTLHFI